MYKPLIYLISTFVLISCTPDQQVADLIITNANIYTVNEKAPKAQSFAVKDRLIIGIGTSEEIQEQFQSTNTIDVSMLRKGIYIIEFVSDDFIIREKLIIE